MNEPKTNSTIFINDFEKEFFSVVNKITDEGILSNRHYTPLFRGHQNSTWNLVPEIGRPGFSEALTEIPNIEHNLYHSFYSLGWEKLKEIKENPWDILFSMRHHGIPTRLLDWTSSLNAGLYFATRAFIKEEPTENFSLFILDSTSLNKATMGEDGFVIPYSLNSSQKMKFNYADFFIKKDSFPNVFVMRPKNTNERIPAQNSFFSFHKDLSPLENSYPELIKKIVINKNQCKYIKKYLRLSETTEYAPFPDLDGLSRHLRVEWFHTL